ncbi:BSD-domain-containing protein [Aureobasidium pullulans]|uniref:BSD-domain-containing protein n=1 Tax=Aureobasidium pullulans TaxID=5580 RepID=A0AB38LX90_AURPU|nr:BSD-domain-containing protein [Aureobasidium pullulans]THZ41392.1 BSD-domain-containing protein [Aureobasidium pullulans]THZ49699.1 BSD-domain-containing protein [Aureobasidium pullulans]
MDFAYDQIQEESLPADASTSSTSTDRPNTDLNTEFQQAFKAVSASPWGARLGGFWSQAKKQGESLYSDAQKEYASRSEQAAKVAGELQKSLVESTKNISINPEAGAANTSFSDPTFALPEGAVGGEREKGKQKEGQTQGGVEATAATAATSRPDSLPADIVKEASSLVSLLRSKATAATANLNLQKIQAAEDAADEALLKFGTGIRSFLRDAVTVTAPSTSATGNTEVLFETNDAEGKRVIHSSRFDAQLHVIHTSAQSFTTDPDSPEYAAFASSFDIAAKTDAIAADLEKYPELRRAMEKLVPEKVDYTTFWTRYYFLRKVIQEEEVRRKEVLKGATQETDEEIAWGSDDSDDEEEDKAATPTKQQTPAPTSTTSTTAPTTASSKPSTTPANTTTSTPTPTAAHEEETKSISSSSETSYDIVSGTTSRAATSPKEEKTEKIATASTTTKKIDEESDEEDWE